MQLKIEYLPVDALEAYSNNTRKHEDFDIGEIAKSIEKFNFNDPIAIWSDHNVIVEGHGRLAAAKKLGMTEVPCVRLDHLTDEQRKAYGIMHNKTAEFSKWDFEALAIELPQVDLSAFDFDFTLPDSNDAWGDETEENNSKGITEEQAKGKLAEKFIVPPFDIFNARGGDWRKRKLYWEAIIGDKAQARNTAGTQIMKNGFSAEKYGEPHSDGTDVSILDAVLCEIVCKWFLPQGSSCNTADCFAGDTVFGFVADYLGHKFTGIELRQEQVDFNNAHTGDNAHYICDDGRNIAQHIPAKSIDLLFSCPPYFDLEVYSEKENDASNQASYEDFYAILDTAFTNAAACLKDNRFAVVVVGDIRNKKNGEYYNFPNDVINTFRRNGFKLYCNIKLLTPIGSACLRAARAMRTRKVTHTYQDVLVFYKGDTKQISSIFGEVETADYDCEDMELE